MGPHASREARISPVSGATPAAKIALRGSQRLVCDRLGWLRGLIPHRRRRRITPDVPSRRKEVRTEEPDRQAVQRLRNRGNSKSS